MMLRGVQEMPTFDLKLRNLTSIRLHIGLAERLLTGLC